jgi:hypothetical protein
MLSSFIDPARSKKYKEEVKMKKMTVLLAGAMLMMASGIASANPISYSSTTVGNDFFTGLSLYDKKVETFNNATLAILPSSGLDQAASWTWSGLGQIFAGSANGASSNTNTSSPFGLTMRDQTKYLSVPNPYSSGFATLNLDRTYDTFGLWWGSVDTYNTISFYKDGIATGDSFNGSVVAPPANGNQTGDATNLFVSFVDIKDFNSVRFDSNGWAFEFDNVTVGNVVPEPGTMMLLGLGMFGMAIFGKRRMNKEA